MTGEPAYLERIIPAWRVAAGDAGPRRRKGRGFASPVALSIRGNAAGICRRDLAFKWMLRGDSMPAAARSS